MSFSLSLWCLFNCFAWEATVPSYGKNYAVKVQWKCWHLNPKQNQINNLHKLGIKPREWLMVNIIGWHEVLPDSMIMTEQLVMVGKCSKHKELHHSGWHGNILRGRNTSATSKERCVFWGGWGVCKLQGKYRYLRWVMNELLWHAVGGDPLHCSCRRVMVTAL